MTDIKVGDHVKVEYEGEVVYIHSDDGVVNIRTTEHYLRSASDTHVTKIDPPVKVGDEISYEQAIRLPHKSVVVGLVTGVAYQVKDGGLRYGDRKAYTAYQPLRVVHIPSNG